MQLMLCELPYKDTESQYTGFCFVLISKSQCLIITNILMFKFCNLAVVWPLGTGLGWA